MQEHFRFVAPSSVVGNKLFRRQAPFLFKRLRFILTPGANVVLPNEGSAFSMSTICSSGASISANASAAVDESIAPALAALGDRKADLAFIFASPKYDLEQVVQEAKARLEGVDILATTTAGEITERGLTRKGMGVLLVSAPDTRHLLNEAQPLGKNAKKLLKALCGEAEAQSGEHRARGRRHRSSILFGDGLSPTFEQLVVEIRKHLPDDHLIVGAGAADEGALVKTVVGSNAGVAEGGVVAVHLWSPTPWATGMGHGLSQVSPRMTVTRASGNIVHEIDGRPAMDVYRDHAKSRGIDLESVPIGQYLIENELGVLLFEQIVRVRAPLRVLEDGSLFCAGEVPESAQVCIVRGAPHAILDAAREAAQQAKDALDGRAAAGILVFSCVCRGMTLGERYCGEVDAIRAVFPDVPIAGFSSYGEVARDPGRLDGYHNNTIVVVAIPE